MSKLKTTYEDLSSRTLANRLRNHPIIVIAGLFIAVVVALGTFTDSLDKIINFAQRYIPAKPPESIKEKTEPEYVLREILRLAREENYEGIRKFLYDWEVNGKSVPDLILEGIRERKQSYDFAYSHEALSLIINYRINETQPMPEKIFKYFAREKVMDDLDDYLRDLILNDPGKFKVFEHKEAFVLLVQVNGTHKLVFWEHLNSVLE